MSFTLHSLIRRWPALALLVALAVFALLVVVGGSTARATLSDGDVVLGGAPSDVSACTPGTDVNCENTATSIANDTSFSNGLEVWSTSGVAVDASTDSGDAVLAQSHASDPSGIAVSAYSDHGRAISAGSSISQPDGAVEADNTGTGSGVYATAGSGAGVKGKSGSGAGVEGDGNDGPGVLGVAGSPGGTALKAKGASTFTGRTFFGRSGKLTVSAGTSEATKSPINLGSASLVLATIQGNQAGVYVQGVTQVSGSTGSFTIHLNANTTADLPVAWFVVN